MKKLIILQGPPASGKSSWCKQFTPEHPGEVVVISCDSIRHSFGEYNMKHEKEVVAIEEKQLKDAMESEIPYIINDATNLNPDKYLKLENIANTYGYEIEYKKFYVPFKEAVQRDKNEDRDHHVGAGVIKQFYRKYFKDELEKEMLKTVDHYRLEQDQTLQKAIICDLDGTLAWMQNRSPYSTTEVDKDKLDAQLAMLLNILMSSGVHVIFTSGRTGTIECREKTISWLEKNLDPEAYECKKLDGTYKNFTLLTRAEKDYRPDEIIKKELFENFIKPYFNVICVFDDRNKVVNMWREIGLLCCQVADGDF